MTERIGAADAKARLGELVARVAYGGERFIIEKRGRPLAALVSVDDLKGAFARQNGGAPRGALALVGVWESVKDREIDAFLAEVYQSRSRDSGRTVDLSD